MSALPSQVNYNEPLLRLPENTTNFLACALPTNGSTFGPGSIAQVDLQTNRGFLDPASISIRYKVNVTSGANGSTTVAKLVGTPVYTFIANISTNISTELKATGYTSSNFEVVYHVIDFGAEIQRQIMAESPQILIKTSSYNTSIAPIASGSNGNINLIYNLRYASIKSAFLNFGGTSTTTCANKNMDSFDITQETGDYSLQIAGMSYPQKSLSSLMNRAGIMNELRRAMGSLYSNNNAMSINYYEFSTSDGDTTDNIKPGKFWVGFNLQKLTIESKAFFSGVSTQNSPITAIINTTDATSQAYNAMLIAVYDAIIEIDTQTKQCVIVS